MIKKIFAAMTALALLAAGAGMATADTLYVDNRETDKIYPERLNLRAEPSKTGDLIGLYYSGTQVETEGELSDGYYPVTIGSVSGYMSGEYLITREEAVSRYGEEGDFFTGRAAQVDLTGTWLDEAVLYERSSEKSTTLGTLRNGDSVELLGILGDEWAYVRSIIGEEEKLGYLALDLLTDVGEYKVLVIAGDKADSRAILYTTPNTKSKEIMSLKNGTACFNLFGRSVGGWRKVRVGGVTGWIRELHNPSFQLLSETERGAIPYYPLQMQTKQDALLYSVKGDKTQRYMTLGAEMKVEVLAESEDYAFVRTLEGGAGTYDRGDFGYIALSDLTLTQAGVSIALAQVDDGDLPAIVLDEPDGDSEMIGALCAGAQIRVTDFTQTDYVQVRLGDESTHVTGYVLKSSVRLLTGAQDELSGRIPQRGTLMRGYAMRTLPDDASEKVRELAAGTRVYMLGVVDGWAFVRAAGTPSLDAESDTDDQTGFIQLDALSAPASTTHLTAMVNTDKVNMREEGSASGDIIAKARLGERLRVADYGTEWTCVVKPDGKRGYIKTQYLVFEQE